jgi:RHS repeat-associated protein
VRKPRFWRFGGIRISRRAIQRATLWVALMAQVSVGLPIDVLARAREQQRAAQSPPAQPGLAQPQPQSAPAPVHVNRTVPKVTPPGARPAFSAEPSDAEITNARIFGEPLVAIGRGTLRGENHALADAVTRYLDAHNPENVLPFLGFLKTYPDSPWRASLLLNLGLVYRHTGYFLRALDVWEQTWLATKTGTDAKARAVADRAVGELFALNARLGRFERLEALFAETKDRVVTGPATEQITAAREGLWMMRNTPEKAFLCGPLAVDQVLAASRAGYVRDEKILKATSTPQGTSLAQMQKLAADLNLPLQMAKRAPGAPVLYPAVVHWRAGHFAALIREADGRFLVRDPTFGDELWVSRAALDDEASGYMLITPQTLPDGWKAVAQTEGEQVWGKGQTDGNDPDDTHDDDEQNDDDDDDDDDDDCGMPRYSTHLMLVSLHLSDTPVGYFPARGPSVPFRVAYNQREAHQPQVFSFSNLGSKWTFDWLSYVEDDPTNPNASAYLTARGGGRDTFQGFNPSTLAYQPDIRTRAVLVRTSSTPIRYERRQSNGYVEVFAQPDGASTSPRRVFLTEVRDPRGNAVTFTYDGQLRLVASTDALGQVTTLSYDDPGDSRRITRVTDPFGRYASFDYDGAGRLAHITDVLGLQSGFTYDGGDFVTALTTPYGTTRFVKGENGLDRWLEITDPLGGKERVEYKANAAIAATDPAGRVPAGIGVTNNFLNYRNTFYWNKRAMAFAPRDPASAHVYHWLHTSGPLNQSSGTLESQKRPLEGRTWYRYPGQSVSYIQGTSNHPTVVARVLDDGQTQTWKTEYNDFGTVTKRTDPLGRETTYVYAANGLDLLEVRQTTAGANDLLMSYSGYTSQHLAQTFVNAAGQTTTYTYNASGQPLTITDPTSAVVTYVYDANGYLQSVSRPMSGATTTYAYDGYGRVQSRTESDGYSLSFLYDAMNRVTRRTYPDGSYDQTTYDRLDAAEQRDRMGRTTRRYFDQLRRLVAVRDPLGRTMTQDWCKNCGSLDAVTDARGQKTSWDRDIQGRVVRERRADGTTASSFTFETYGGRLATVTDAKAQTVTYAYNLDNTPQSVAYANTVMPTPTVSYTYDSVYLRLVSMTDGTGTTLYAYKPLGVLGATQLASIDGPLTNDTMTYAYDELGRMTSRLINGVGSTYAFDMLGRQSSEVNALGTFTYAYDGTTERIASLTYPNGQLATYSYYGALGDDRLQTLHHKRSDGSTLSRFDYTYDAVGNIATLRQQADNDPAVSWSYGYDADDQMMSAVERTTDTTPVTLKRYAYLYDAAGNRVTEQIDDAVTAATYDGLNRLTGRQAGGALRVSGTVSEPATVDIQGKPATVTPDNRFDGSVPTTAGTNVFTVTATDPSGNSHAQAYQVDVTASNQTFTYDANGNLTSDGTRTFEWDGSNQLLAVTAGTHRSEYAYDGQQRRVHVAEKVSGVLQSEAYLVWCGTRICEERASDGTTVVRRAFEQGEQVGGVVHLFTTDHLGSLREVTDTSASVLTRFAFDPWGRRTIASGTDTTSIGYTSHRRDASGLWLARYRGYDPDTGRWLSEDPIKFAGGLNLYAYVLNNPITRVDPFGLQARNANTYTYGEIRQWAIKSLQDLDPPDGLGDAKTSIGVVCAITGRCQATDGSNAQEPGDKAAWDNITNADGKDQTGGGNTMCVGTQQCQAVDKCWTCKGNKMVLIDRKPPLPPSGTVMVNGHPVYFYRDDLGGWCDAASRNCGCKCKKKKKK